MHVGDHAREHEECADTRKNQPARLRPFQKSRPTPESIGIRVIPIVFAL